MSEPVRDENDMGFDSKNMRIIQWNRFVEYHGLWPQQTKKYTHSHTHITILFGPSNPNTFVNECDRFFVER